jgi:general secretion pathway protein A
MYLEFYGLLKEPFGITPDPEFLYLSPSHKEALGVILYGVENRAGFMMITGGVGLGKTTILCSALQRFNAESTRTVLIFNPCLTYTELIRLIYEELGIETPVSDDQFQLIQRLHLALIEEYKKGRNVVLVVDEAQNMPAETLENLRMLSNLETSKDKLIQIILVGQQPELENLLGSDALRQLKQRITHRATLVNLTQQESAGYIRHRIDIALGVRNSPFTKAAVKRIAKHCDGVPRRINIVSKNALVYGYGLAQIPIGSGLVREVIDDLEGRRKSQTWAWLAAPLVLLLIVSLGLYFHATGKVFSWKRPSNATIESRSTAKDSEQAVDGRDIPRRRAAFDTADQVPAPSRADAAQKSGNPFLLNSTAVPTAPNRQSPPSTAPAETARPSRPPLPDSADNGSSGETRSSVPGPPKRPFATENSAHAEGPSSLQKNLASNAGNPSDRPLPAADAGILPSAKAVTHDLPSTKSESQPDPPTPPVVAREKPSAGSPDPSEIIDWLIDKRIKQKASRAN